ncbi:MAG: MarR family transcriptional regulator [Gammaproteobacteria bacterium]|nr:MarR family transcriptional regulator [Gammaproteobacteria bacterium]
MAAGRFPVNRRGHRLLQQIGRTGRAMYAAFETQVGQALPRWRILQALHERKSATQKQLTAQLLINPGALTRQMKTLEQEGLIARRNNPQDRRSTTVSLTPSGRAALRAAQPARKAFLRQALRGLPEERQSAAMETLELLERRFRAMLGP